MVTCSVVVVVCRFNPPNSLEFSSKEGNNQLLAVSVDSADGTILVKASDWPYTLFSPYVLGDADWSDKYISSNFFWSKDGTLLVWEVQERNERFKRYEAAYDFHEHSGIGLKKYIWNTQECNEAIAKLLRERGGSESYAIEIPALNSGLYR